MQSFRDTKGRLWDLEVTVSTARRVRRLTGVDLVGLFDDGLRPLAGLLSDVCKLADVLYAVVQPVAEERGVTDEMFGEALAGQVIEHAAEALTAAVLDFFPDQAGRENLRQVIRKGKIVAESMTREAGRRLEEIDPEAVAQKIIQATLPVLDQEENPSGMSSGTVPASSASTPDP